MLSSTKSRVSGKWFLFLSLLISLVCFCSSAFAKLVIVELNQDDIYFARPMRVALSPGDSLMFRSINGDFSIFIEEAIVFLEIDETDLKVEVNTTKPQSPVYIVRKIEENWDQTYSIFCISNSNWPDAPPRIIIVSQ